MSFSDQSRTTQSEFAGLRDRVFAGLEECSIFESNFLMRAHLEDFLAGVDYLIKLKTKSESTRSAKDVNAVEKDKDFKPTVRRLCELSRDVMFSCDAKALPDEIRNNIEQLFVFAAERIPSSNDAEIQDYRRNINNRKLEIPGDSVPVQTDGGPSENTAQGGENSATTHRKKLG